MAFTASQWGQGQLLTGLSPVSTESGFVTVITKDNFPSSAFDTGPTSCLNGGGDWRFSTDINGANQVPCEIVTCVTSAVPANVEFVAWVRFPTYSSANREVYAFWNKAGETQPLVGSAFGRNAVWSDFELVIHQGTTTDSTGNHAPSLTGSPSLSNMLWGGQGYDIQSINQYLSVAHAAGLNAEKDYSIDCWVDTGTIGDGDVRTLYDKTTSNTDGYIGTVSNSAVPPNGVARHRNPNLTNSNLDIANANGIQRLSYYFDGTTRTISRDATTTNSDTPTGTVVNNSEPLLIGNRYDFQRPVQSILGDFWLAIPERQTDRTLEQSNQSSPATFWTAGSVFVPVGGTQFLLPTGIATDESLGTPTVKRLLEVVSGAGAVASAESFGTPIVTSFDQFVLPTSIGSGESFGTPNIVKIFAGQTISPTGIASEESLGVPVLVYAQVVSPTGIVSEEIFGRARIIGGDTLVIPPEFRDSFGAVARFLRTQGYDGNNNDVIKAWLIDNNCFGSYNDSWVCYWKDLGFSGSFEDLQEQWKNN